MNSVFIDENNIHPDWNDFLTQSLRADLRALEKKIINDKFTPDPENVLRFLKLPLKKAKVLILGQDPYPQKGVATGRAFEVKTLDSWNKPFRNVSLKNILRTLYKAYFGEVISYRELKTRLDNEFPVLPPNRIFEKWETEGVLLLNTSFTCKIGSPGSHEKIWVEFTRNLLKFINHQNPGLYWFLWGNHAARSTQNIHIKNKIVSHHPMMCYKGDDRENDFLYGHSNCFESFIGEIDWTGYDLKPGMKRSLSLF